jgi:hypothetical protein
MYLRTVPDLLDLRYGTSSIFLFFTCHVCKLHVKNNDITPGSLDVVDGCVCTKVCINSNWPTHFVPSIAPQNSGAIVETY